MRVAFLGFGLIGGSIARALHGAPGGEATSLVAWSPSGDGPRLALAEGVLDAAAATPQEAIAGADLVVLAASPLDCLALLDGLGGPWRSSMALGASVTDVASTKATIVDRADTLGLPFVGGHPMAGRETVGYVSSTEDLFVDRPWVIVPGASSGDGAVERVEWLATACGARPMRMTATAHDLAVAGTSHLPLILAAALVEAVTDGGFETSLTAGGWRDMTRLARGDVAMGAGIVETNGAAVAARIRDLQAVLEAWLTDLEATRGPDAGAVSMRVAAVTDRLRAAKARLEALD